MLDRTYYLNFGADLNKAQIRKEHARRAKTSTTYVKEDARVDDYVASQRHAINESNEKGGSLAIIKARREAAQRAESQKGSFKSQKYWEWP